MMRELTPILIFLAFALLRIFGDVLSKWIKESQKQQQTKPVAPIKTEEAKKIVTTFENEIPDPQKTTSKVPAKDQTGLDDYQEMEEQSIYSRHKPLKEIDNQEEQREWRLDDAGGWEDDWRDELKKIEAESREKIAKIHSEATFDVQKPLVITEQKKKSLKLDFSPKSIVGGIIFSQIIDQPAGLKNRKS